MRTYILNRWLSAAAKSERTSSFTVRILYQTRGTLDAGMLAASCLGHAGRQETLETLGKSVPFTQTFFGDSTPHPRVGIPRRTARGTVLRSAA